MKQQLVRHGEVLLVPTSEIPGEAKLLKTGKSHMVAHSETGHHHVLQLATPKLSVYQVGKDTYLDVGDIGQLVHKKTGPDVHKTHTIAPGKYKVVIKQAFDYFTKALTRVRD